MKIRFTLTATAVLLTTTIASASPVQANDFPTQARVEFVLQCVKDNGGETYKNLYGCICIIDNIAEKMSYAEFEEANTFGAMRMVPGERSGVFRENARGKALAETSQEVRDAAASACLMPTGN